jgi:hypothetical protein
VIVAAIVGDDNWGSRAPQPSRLGSDSNAQVVSVPPNTRKSPPASVPRIETANVSQAISTASLQADARLRLQVSSRQSVMKSRQVTRFYRIELGHTSEWLDIVVQIVATFGIQPSALLPKLPN